MFLTAFSVTMVTYLIELPTTFVSDTSVFIRGGRTEVEDGSDVSLCSPICDDKPPDTKVNISSSWR